MDDDECEGPSAKKYNFVTKLYQHLAEDVKDNVLFSPINIHLLLSALLQGSNSDDSTAQNLQTLLEIPDANSAATDYKKILNEIGSINGSFVMTSKLEAGLSVEISEKLKNSFAENFNMAIEMQNNEPNNISMSGTVNFHSDWFYKFDTDVSKKEIFRVSANEQIEVEMLRVRCYLNTKFYRDPPSFHLVEIPCKNKDHMKMIILLPFQEDEFGDLEEKLSMADLNDVFNGTRPLINEVWIPRFKIECSIDLSHKLAAAGLFNKEQFNISNMASGKSDNDVHLDRILHTATMEMSEKGQEPNPRSPTPYRSCIDLGPKHFKVDHPAIFFVTTKCKNGPEWSSDIILCGKLYRPC